MKTTLILAASLFVSVGAFGQGTIIFVNNFGAGKAPIYAPDLATPTVSKKGNTPAGLPAGTQVYTGALLSGTGFTAELWGAAGGQALAESALTALGQSTFRTGTAAGFINSATISVPNAPLAGASPVAGTFQVRAWDNKNGTVTTWAAVTSAANNALGRGKSDLIGVPGLGGTGSPATPDPNLVGLTSFSLAVVPEPSAIALGIIGLGSLMFLRRRK